MKTSGTTNSIRNDRTTAGRREKGFTLIELIAVVVIMSLVFLFAAARFDFLIPEYALRGAAREVGGILKLAKDHAALTGRDVYVEYSLPDGSYRLLAPIEQEEEGDEEAPVTEAKEDAPVKPPTKKKVTYEESISRVLPQGIEFVSVVHGKGEVVNTGKVIVRITPFGFSEHHIVNLRNDENRAMGVKLNGFTGGLTFYDELKEPDALLQDE
ncbi:MAG: hypothetical protein A2Z34_09495 [Planctomycetes bacterium RBG_16_59_8]|nr:MAG: hypothetical protein A2Z34_09495 [Planctomycetes bacterium RBG_16_59_8]